MENKENLQKHSLIVENKKIANITQVAEVVSVTEKSAYLKLVDGAMQICGTGLKIEKLSPEEKIVTIIGEITKIEYLGQAGGKGFFKKLFK